MVTAVIQRESSEMGNRNQTWGSLWEAEQLQAVAGSSEALCGFLLPALLCVGLTMGDTGNSVRATQTWCNHRTTLDISGLVS